MSSVTYNARGQVTAWTHGRFQDLAYAYDPVGNPVLLTDQLATSTFTSNTIIPNTRRFAYDPRYRLVAKVLQDAAGAPERHTSLPSHRMSQRALDAAAGEAGAYTYTQLRLLRTTQGVRVEVR